MRPPTVQAVELGCCHVYMLACRLDPPNERLAVKRTRTLAATALLALTATAVGGSQASASPKTTTQLAAVPDRCAELQGGLPMINMTDDQFAAFSVCDALELGDSARVLRTAEIAWDASCVSAQGWELDQASNTPVPPARPSRALDAGDLAPCGTVALSDSECLALGDQLSPGGLSPTVSVVLHTLGCDEAPVGASGS